MRALVTSACLVLGPVALAQNPYTIFTGPGAGNVIFSADGVNAFGPNTFGTIGTGPHCPPGSLTIGDITLGPTSDHFHGMLNGQTDPDSVNCGWGHTVPGDFKGLFSPAVQAGVTRTVVLPHIFETKGTTSTQFSFDFSILTEYAVGIQNAPVGAGEVKIFMFDDQTGQLLKDGNGQDVCDPCTFAIGSGSLPRKRTVVLDDEITANGAGFPRDIVLGFAIAVVKGDVDDVNLTSAVTNSKSNPLDLSVFVFEPQAINSPLNAPPVGPLPGAPAPRLLKVDNIRETPGSTSVMGGVSDTLLKGVYVAGLVDGMAPASVNIKFTLFNPDGTPVSGATGILEPLEVTLDGNNRTFAMTVEEMLASAGGITGPIEGYALAEISGDTDHFVLAGYHIQTASGPNDLLHFDQTLAVQVVPEPAGMLLLGGGALAWGRRRRNG